MSTSVAFFTGDAACQKFGGFEAFMSRGGAPPIMAAGVTGTELIADGGDLGAEVDVLEAHRDLGHL